MCAYIILYFSATDTPVSHLRRGEWGERRGDYESAIIFTISINVPIDDIDNILMTLADQLLEHNKFPKLVLLSMHISLFRHYCIL